MPAIAKALKGFGNAGVQELVIREQDGTWRVVYTVTLPDAVYVLHAFNKKSKRGSETPKRDIDLVKQRLGRAQEISAERARETEKR